MLAILQSSAAALLAVPTLPRRILVTTRDELRRQVSILSVGMEGDDRRVLVVLQRPLEGGTLVGMALVLLSALACHVRGQV